MLEPLSYAVVKRIEMLYISVVPQNTLHCSGGVYSLHSITHIRGHDPHIFYAAPVMRIGFLQMVVVVGIGFMIMVCMSAVQQLHSLASIYIFVFRSLL